LEKQSRNFKAEAGVFTHILLLNYEDQRLTTTYYSKETSKQQLQQASGNCTRHQRNLFTYTIIDKIAKQFDSLVWDLRVFADLTFSGEILPIHLFFVLN
jgi:hypothetical protein